VKHRHNRHDGIAVADGKEVSQRAGERVHRNRAMRNLDAFRPPGRAAGIRYKRRLILVEVGQSCVGLAFGEKQFVRAHIRSLIADNDDMIRRNLWPDLFV
jgi:hypothetical protein